MIAAPLPDDPGLAAVLAALPRARIVGGAVRDLLAGRPIADIDLATPDRPEAVIAALEAAGLRVIPTGLAHGTVTALAHGRGFEITTLRHDVETDGRHATVAFIDDWCEDAARRDFTINAMSLDRHGTLFDYFGGADDLAAGRVRFVGDPARRIAEDALRILRFFRFQARYGGDPDAATLAALAAGVPGLALLSAERVWSELKRILATPAPLAALRLMRELGVLAAVLPEAGDLATFATLVETWAPADPVLRLAAILDPAIRVKRYLDIEDGGAEQTARRLRLSNEESKRLNDLLAAPPPPHDAGDDDLRRALADTPPEILVGRTWLAGPDWRDLRRRLLSAEAPRFPLAGRDALALGYPPGVAVGEALRAVRKWWLAGGCHADAEACRARLAALRASRQPL